MKKIIGFLGITFTLSVQAQDSSKNILKVTYRTSPISQYKVNNSSNRSAADKALDLELNYAHKRYYTLLLNLQTRASVYKYDSLNFIKPKGREDVQLMLADNLSFCNKTDSNITYKFETIFGRKFYSQGYVGDIEWEITTEKKQLLGFNCTKAVAKDKGLLLTVWYTNEVPVSSGPVNYFGLPGLVVWAEDFFRTTQIEKIEYANDFFGFEQEMEKHKKDFEENKGNNYLKERLFMEKKKELVQSLRQMVSAQ
jgi:GLPGLI family protein